MTKTLSSHDQIISHIWDVQALLSKGHSVEDACEKLEIQPQNYQRWHREFGVQKPEHVKCQEELIAADKKNDAYTLLQIYPRYRTYKENGKINANVGFVLDRKFAILDKVHLYCKSVDTRAHTHRGAQAWEVGPADSANFVDQIHTIIQKEFEFMLQFLLMSAQKKNKPVPSNLMSNISIDVKGEAGKSLATDLFTVFTGRDLTPKQKNKLKEDWTLLGAYIGDIAQTVKGL